MRGLLGDRFLRKFAGDLKHRRKHPGSNITEQNPEAEIDAAPGPTVTGPDSQAAEENHEKGITDGEDKPNDQGENKKGEIEL
ncbi:MAG TPA: hypothetical protein VMS73_04075 [Anaerolineaceae bacterium]|nr:hypothetical protein [Anaerolineaceae bacterium]